MSPSTSAGVPGWGCQGPGRGPPRRVLRGWRERHGQRRTRVRPRPLLSPRETEGFHPLTKARGPRSVWIFLMFGPLCGDFTCALLAQLNQRESRTRAKRVSMRLCLREGPPPATLPLAPTSVSPAGNPPFSVLPRHSPSCSRLLSVPGIHPLSASAPTHQPACALETKPRPLTFLLQSLLWLLAALGIKPSKSKDAV